MSKYSIGVDFGSLSGRAVLVEVDTGEELAVSVLEYPHAVMDKTLPGWHALRAGLGFAAPKRLHTGALVYHPSGDAAGRGGGKRRNWRWH